MKTSFLLCNMFIMVLTIIFNCKSQSVENQKQITFNVSPKILPDSAIIFITGNHEKLGNWQPDFISLEKQPDGSWSKTINFELGAELEFKITRGSWQTEAVSAEGIVLTNHRLKVTKDDSVFITVANWRDNIFKVVGQITGEVRYHRELTAAGLRPRDIIVWLPPGYGSDFEKRYPVLYMHDGQNIIDPKTAFISVDWQVDEVADSLITKGEIQEILIVGIYNTDDRVEEYSDTKKGRAYMNFIINYLKPFIDSTYRTLPEREFTATMGSSMGGLISFLLAWNHSDIFSMAGCLSPAFVPPYAEAVQTVKKSPGPENDLRIYLDNGGVGLDAQLQPGCEAMLSALSDRGFKMHQNLEWFHDLEAEHSERAWAKRVWRPLLFMFAKKE